MDRIESLEKTVCTGCTACKASCPVGAISMKEDIDGFVYPYIDDKRCIYCEKCAKICPEWNAKTSSLCGREPMKMFAMKHRNKALHQTSQSGGVFYALAQKEIKQGGVVFGAAFVEDFMVAHIRIDQESDLPRLQGSKYVQSDMQDVISQIKSLLKDDRHVLFCGTPCQCAGVRNACENDMQKLLLIDLICHGVPSKKLWRDFLQNTAKRHKGEITNAVFRVMDGSRKGHIERISVNGTEYESTTYGQLFYSHAFFRDSCDHCSYRSYQRVGDLTLGDWIYGQKVASDFYERTGVSQVMVTTRKGEKWIQDIMDSFSVLPLNHYECMQPPLAGEYQCHPKKQAIQKTYRTRGFHAIVRKYGHEDNIQKLSRMTKRMVKRIKNRLRKKKE